MLGISRSALYRLFEPHGGVSAFIQGRRLDRIHALLAAPKEHRKLSEIAYQHGFASDAHFSTAFRQRFGYSPREAREGAARQRNGTLHEAAAAADYHDWLRRLHG